MAYQALYRKYRSQRFDGMIGQEVVTTTLKNAIVNHQISHAYLFSGPRGTGKTSAAKIFAKAINCPNQTDGEPCNECDICLAITNGSLEDVIELDAASNNGVDQIREIRDKSTYAASQATYKVYIIDEVHMLSISAFNALLKTLEEPTDNVVFVLATTELQKVPATIISRVQRFAFKSISTLEIQGHLAEILNEEQVDFEERALEVLAKSAEGGMRDALSLLDQALSFSDGHLKEKDALLVTGSIASDALVAYVEAISSNNAEAAFEQLDALFAEGKNMLRFAEDLLSYFRDLLLGDSELTHGRIYQWIEIGIDSLKSMKETTQVKIAADVMTMRLAEVRNNGRAKENASQEIPDGLADELTSLKAQVASLKQQLEVLSSNGSLTAGQNQAKAVAPVARASRPQSKAVSPLNKKVIFSALSEATNEARISVNNAWEELIQSLSKPAERAIINNTKPVAASENFVVVTFPHANLAVRITEDEEFRAKFGNILSSIVGFAPELIALAEQDWVDIRAEYAASVKGTKSLKTDEENEKVEDKSLSLAKEMFGDKVVVVND